MTHHRLFVAFALPIEVRATLVAAMGGVAGARWQDDNQLHCTVRFLGKLDRHLSEDVAAALKAVSHPPIDAPIDGIGVFDRGGRIDTLWVAVRPLATLLAVHTKVGRLLGEVGIVPDGRAYRPHVTIARFGARDAPPPDLVARVTPPPQIRCRLDEFRLYESLLGRDGARYRIVARYPLR